MGNILAIDPALTLGWAHTESPGGVWRNPGETDGERFAFFGGWLEETLAYFPSQVIVFERTFQQGKANELAKGWEAIIKLAAHSRGIDLKSCTASQLKKHATGSGKATKAEMIAAGIARGWKDQEYDHNHCDALWLLDWCVSN